MNDILKAVVEQEFNEQHAYLVRLEKLLEQTKVAILGEEPEMRYELEVVKSRTEDKIIDIKIELKKLAQTYKQATA